MAKRSRQTPKCLEDVIIDADPNEIASHRDLDKPKYLNEIQSSELKSLSEGVAGSEFQVLSTLTKLIVSGHHIDDDFQKVVNLIVAKSILRGKLPEQSKGRPKSRNGVDGQLIARKYIELMAGGMKYADVVAELSQTFFKEERQIMRIVKENRIQLDAINTLKQLTETLPDLGEHIAALATALAQTSADGAKRSDPSLEALEVRRLVDGIDVQIDSISRTKTTTVNK